MSIIFKFNLYYVNYIQIHFGNVMCTYLISSAGPLALAKDILKEDREPFFVLNSDISCEFPFREMIDYHTRHGKEGTIVVSTVVNNRLAKYIL